MCSCNARITAFNNQHLCLCRTLRRFAALYSIAFQLIGVYDDPRTHRKKSIIHSFIQFTKHDLHWQIWSHPCLSLQNVHGKLRPLDTCRGWARMRVTAAPRWPMGGHLLDHRRRTTRRRVDWHGTSCMLTAFGDRTQRTSTSAGAVRRLFPGRCNELIIWDISEKHMPGKFLGIYPL